MMENVKKTSFKLTSRSFGIRQHISQGTKANNNGLGFRHGHDHVLMDFPLHEPED